MLILYSQSDCKCLERGLYLPISWSTSPLTATGSEVSLARFLALPFVGYATLEKLLNFSGSLLPPLCGERDNCTTYLKDLGEFNWIIHVQLIEQYLAYCEHSVSSISYQLFLDYSALYGRIFIQPYIILKSNLRTETISLSSFSFWVFSWTLFPNLCQDWMLTNRLWEKVLCAISDPIH